MRNLFSICQTVHIVVIAIFFLALSVGAFAHSPLPAQPALNPFDRDLVRGVPSSLQDHENEDLRVLVADDDPLFESCKSEINRDAKIAICTKAIEAARKGGDPWWALQERSSTYSKKHEYQQALSDKSEQVAIIKKEDCNIHADDDVGCSIVPLKAARRLRAIWTYDSRAGIYKQMGAFDLAIADYTELLRGEADKSVRRGILWARSQVYSFKGDYAQALGDCNAIVKIKADDTAYTYRGVYYLWSGDNARALEDFDRAVALNRKSIGALAGRAAVFNAKGQHDLALAEFAKAAEIDGKLKPTERAIASLRTGNVDSALADFKNMDRATEDILYVFAHAEALEMKGMPEAAMEDYRAIVERTPIPHFRKPVQEKAHLALARLQRESPAAAFGQADMPAEKVDAPPERRVALIIGNAAYANAGRLANPRGDAASVAVALRRLGFSKVVEEYDLTLDQMKRVLRDFSEEAEGTDWAVIYFAGHGMQVDGRNFLIPVDAQLLKATDVEDETVDLSRVMDRIANAKKLRLVILDACRNNPYLSRMTQVGRVKRALDRGLSIVEPQHGELVVFATRDGHVAEDGNTEHSPFTAALLQHIVTPKLDIRIMFSRVRDTVLKNSNNVQEPFTYGSLPGDEFYFASSGK
jgi:tetratricopeptide (TPR) repeat protein